MYRGMERQGKGAPRPDSGRHLARRADRPGGRHGRAVQRHRGGREAGGSPPSGRMPGAALSPAIAETFVGGASSSILADGEADDGARRRPRRRRWSLDRSYSVHGIHGLPGVAAAFADIPDLKVALPVWPLQRGRATRGGRRRPCWGWMRPPRRAPQADRRRCCTTWAAWASRPGHGVGAGPRRDPGGGGADAAACLGHSERVLARSAALAPMAEIAGMHHERLDGSGYHRRSQREEGDRPCRRASWGPPTHTRR